MARVSKDQYMRELHEENMRLRSLIRAMGDLRGVRAVRVELSITEEDPPRIDCVLCAPAFSEDEMAKLLAGHMGFDKGGVEKRGTLRDDDEIPDATDGGMGAG